MHGRTPPAGVAASARRAPLAGPEGGPRGANVKKVNTARPMEGSANGSAGGGPGARVKDGTVRTRPLLCCGEWRAWSDGAVRSANIDNLFGSLSRVTVTASRVGSGYSWV